ncbi:MAG: hypothetical protein GY851_35680 [bacterium]|nr:hypothetical protein [bacterium]
MRRVKRWRYYCDYCKKSGCSGGHMKKHERGCTMNPNRHCGVCDVAGLAQHDIEDLKACIDPDTLIPVRYFPDKMEVYEAKAAATLAAVEELAEGCPACMLAAFRQSNVIMAGFDYKKRMDGIWSEVNDEQASWR